MVSAKDSRKRKGMEVGESSNAAARGPVDLLSEYVAIHGKPYDWEASRFPLFGPLETPRVQQALNRLSYQHLLMDAPDPEGYLRHFDHPGNTNTSQPIDQTIALHGEILRSEISNMVPKIGEQAENRLKELDSALEKASDRKGYLERMTSLYRDQVEDKRNKVDSLQRDARSLKNAVNEAYEEFIQAKDGPEDAESYYVDPVALGPVKLDCITCKRQVATVMVMPCRHLCICMQCKDMIRACPVCINPMENSVEVFLPYD